MMTTVAKPADRQALITDAAYFAGELLKRLERLSKIDGRHEVMWRQAAILTRRVRSAARSRGREDRR